MTRSNARNALFYLFLSVAVTPRCARAQGDAAAARQLFEQGRSLAKGGHYAEACPKFEQSYERDPGIGTLFNLADCWEHLGRTASAWAKFRDVEDEAARTAQKDREKVAHQRAQRLYPQLSYMVVRMPSAPPEVVLKRDGTSFPIADLDRPLPLDPGEYRFAASAPGKESFETSISVPANGQTVEVSIPALADAPTAGPPASSAPLPQLASPMSSPLAPAPRDVSAPPGPSAQRTVAMILAGVGVAGLTVGTYYGMRFVSERDKVNSVCPSGRDCTPEDLSNYDSALGKARDARTVAYVGFGIAGAALATSAVLFLTTPSRQDSAWKLSPTLQPHHLGATFTSRF